MRARDILPEKWSEKYKRSINCSSPKGFSQRAHCQGRKKNEDVNLNELNVAQTLSFIKQAHSDQLYGKLPYWRHPRAVALTGKKVFGSKFNSNAVKVAFLHDVVEDTDVGLEELSKLGFDPAVVEAVGLLTKDKSLSYRQNIERIINSGNPLAMMVKYADNYENYTGDKSDWDPKRASSSQKKYLASLNMLGDVLGVKHHIGEDQHPNEKPQGPETKPTMPAGTVRVDVSDVYDWYKLGQHISNMKGLGKHDFGKGPPSTIFSFGSEDEEHEYLKDLEKIGLTTTDIDPKDPKQPKGMKRQKTDPTYNVESITTEDSVTVDKLIEHFREFLKLCMEELDLKSLPKIEWVTDGDIHKHRHSFGVFKNKNKTLRVEVTNRHPVDIMRTLAHELVHYRQMLDGRLKPGSGDTGSDIENEAHAVTGVIMRKFDDRHPDVFELKPVMENFADGKVKGKSRPGRVKKAGASCKGSVTSLRQKAKKYGGERGKMYHWCANMKGGKK